MFSGCKDTQTSADFFDTDDERYEGAFITELTYRMIRLTNR